MKNKETRNWRRIIIQFVVFTIIIFTILYFATVLFNYKDENVENKKIFDKYYFILTFVSLVFGYILAVKNFFSFLFKKGKDKEADKSHQEIEKLLNDISNKISIKKEHLEIIDNEIRESNATNISIENKEPIVGVDFGSNNSLCAIYKESEGIVFISSDKGQQIVPTCITFFENGYYIVGKPAYCLITDTVTITDFKREIGRNKEYKVFDRVYSAEELTVLFLKSLKLNIENCLNIQTYRILVSRPVNFSITQNGLLKDCFLKAGFNILRNISESSLSSLNVDVDPDNNFVTLVIDIGGGTVDVGIVNSGYDVHEIMAVIGDNYLGGVDFDNAIYDYCIKDFFNRNIVITKQEQTYIKYESERIKKDLTNKDSSKLILRDKETNDGNLADYEVNITKALFREITKELNKKILQIIQQAQKENWITSKFDAIYLCGQGCKIFTIRELIEKEFPNIPIIDKFKENAVINGLAEYSNVLYYRYNENADYRSREVNKLLVDTIGYTIGLKCKETGSEENFATISTNQDENLDITTFIENPTTLPTKRSEEFIVENNNSKKSLVLNFVIFDEKEKVWNTLQNYDLKTSDIIETISILLDIGVDTTIKASIGYNKKEDEREVILYKLH